MSPDRATENPIDPLAAAAARAAQETDRFELDGDCRLKVRLDGGIWIKTGAVLQSAGSLTFRRERLAEFGLLRLLKRVACRAPRMTRADGSGNLCLADSPKKIFLVRLCRESLWVGAADILAMELTLERDFAPLRRLAGLRSANNACVQLHGSGLAAVCTRYELIKLKGSPRSRESARRDAANWPGGLRPEFKVGVSQRGAGVAAARQFSLYLSDCNESRSSSPAEHACAANS